MRSSLDATPVAELRPELFAIAGRLREFPLVLVAAPASSGKTTRIAALFARELRELGEPLPVFLDGDGRANARVSQAASSVLFQKFAVESSRRSSWLGVHRDRVSGPLARRATEA